MIQAINGEIKKHGLPKSFVKPSGETVLNYHLQDEETLKQDGWLPVEEIRPDYNPEIEEVHFERYEILEDKVVKYYKAEPIQKSQIEILEEKLLTPTEIYSRLNIESTPLEQLKQFKKNQLDYLCTQTILGRFSVKLSDNTYEFSNDTEAQLRFTGIGVMFMDNKINEIEWTTYLNDERIRITLNKSDFDIVSYSALSHQNINIVKYNNMLKVVNDCTTNEEVDSVKW